MDTTITSNDLEIYVQQTGHGPDVLGFEVMQEESHQPFQEVPDEWNARVNAFWSEIEG